MGKVFLVGGMGAIVNCAIAIQASTLSLERLVAEILVQPFSALRSLTPAVLGFMIGSAMVLAWTFLRAVTVRFLLAYDGWFLKPKNPINKLWYLLMLVLVGRKNWGAGNYQQMLPTYPVPSLDKTLKKYIESVRPILTADEYQKTEKAVKGFKKQGGKKLQFYLKLRSYTQRNWLSEWWLKYVYLRQRTPIPFNSNYFASGCRYPKTNNQLDRAAMLMYCACQGTLNLKHGKMKNMLAQNLVPFCMEGITFCACACRIPGKEEDEIKNYSSTNVEHIVVFRKGKMYKVKVKSNNGTAMPPALIKKQLQQIVDMAGDEISQDGYTSAFTALPRAKWAEIRDRLIKDPVNKESIEAIQSAFLIFVLADETPDADDFTDIAQKLFHGNCYDRWFDKCISVIVFGNALVGSNAEHARLDATVCGQYWEYMLCSEHYDDNGNVPELTEDDSKKYTILPKPERLNWNLAGFEDDLRLAKTNLQAMINDSDMLVMQPSYGKGFPKKCRLSPDGWIQMALQLTYYRIHKKFVLTYESATTRLYYKGRTETIRPVSDKSKKWVEAMEDDSFDTEERKKLLKEAIGVQEQRKFEAMRGMGTDRHMFGLYIMAQWLKMDPMPDLFNDKAFQLPFNLSTSQTPVSFVQPYNKEKASMIGGFGTVTENGYGVSYLINGDDQICFVIHSRKCCLDTSSPKFASILYQSLEDMKALYETSS